jgi:hypothetical protein
VGELLLPGAEDHDPGVHLGVVDGLGGVDEDRRLGLTTPPSGSGHAREFGSICTDGMLRIRRSVNGVLIRRRWSSISR